MQQHTRPASAVGGASANYFGFPTLSFHMGDEVSTIELGTKEITRQQIDEAEIVRQRRGARCAGPSMSGLKRRAGGGLAEAEPASGTLRIIEIEGIDKSACGGTHVRSLAETLAAADSQAGESARKCAAGICLRWAGDSARAAGFQTAARTRSPNGAARWKSCRNR